ncbi:HEPN domain-containing protein [Candidatus Symbiothrix dinenymphae]|uniref:HEPN domain-containing protein n=1 Tax=Candidatus Symbiothrix dinenymphae TaxID=467085 RepID=UPI0006C5CE8F|nr:HEPN domain-containing protein [Candidatus Symbiothrix dinenymphae]GAP73339.1 hypothetical protein SAMD00024442_8_33 [Candidatus Symbiothrix dinenymphae]
MATPIINADKIAKHWADTSDDDFVTMEAMLATKQYNWALFLGHIVIEKLLKAYYVKVKCQHAPLSHNLLHLAQDSSLILTKEQKISLAKITNFNINARYDDYKRDFYTMCTAEFTAEWSERIKQLRLWIKEML